MTNFDDMTKDQAIDILVTRIAAKWPETDIAKERATLAKRSRARLLHSVGAQLYGDVSKADLELMRYARDQMTDSELRVLSEAG